MVFERNDVGGGVWLENDYPGCRLDTSNFCYSYSFLQRDDWPHQFSRGPEIREYFQHASKQLGLREHIEDPRVARNMELGLFEVTQIPPGRAGEPQIEVAFHVDASGAFSYDGQGCAHRPGSAGAGALTTAASERRPRLPAGRSRSR